MSKNFEKLDTDKILDWFRSGEKKKDDWLIGTEHEKFLFKKDNFQRLKYDEKLGIKSILEEISTDRDWKPIIEQNNIIGLKHKEGSSISLEPGGQLELSGAPLKSLHDTCKEAGKHLKLMKKLSEKFNFVMVGISHDPKSSKDEIGWINNYVIPIEQSFLREKFGDEYERYLKAVKKWMFF